MLLRHFFNFYTDVQIRSEFWQSRTYLTALKGTLEDQETKSNSSKGFGENLYDRLNVNMSYSWTNCGTIDGMFALNCDANDDGSGFHHDKFQSDISHRFAANKEEFKCLLKECSVVRAVEGWSRYECEGKEKEKEWTVKTLKELANLQRSTYSAVLLVTDIHCIVHRLMDREEDDLLIDNLRTIHNS
jgi:hypothetical protein